MRKVITLYGSDNEDGGNEGCGPCGGVFYLGGRLYLTSGACAVKLMLYLAHTSFTIKCNKIHTHNGFLLSFLRYPSVFMVICK